MSRQSKKMNFQWGPLVSGEKGEGAYSTCKRIVGKGILSRPMLD
jgi:hypothetical protein